eukprot:scaffold6002_cov110-Isochrysis_galbana.AAC.11
MLCATAPAPRCRLRLHLTPLNAALSPPRTAVRTEAERDVAGVQVCKSHAGWQDGRTGSAFGLQLYCR